MSNLIAPPIQPGVDRHLEDFLRPDGRMEVYDVQPSPDGLGYQCFWCDIHPLYNHRRWPSDKAFLCSPVHAHDAQAKMICIEHLPDDAVIYNPGSNKCRDKTGQNVWEEPTGMPIKDPRSN